MIEDANIIYWLIAGLLMIFLEVSLVTGIGILFAGLSACLVAFSIQMNWISQDDILWQFIWFFALTGAWALVLWKPLQQFQNRNPNLQYKNIVGDMVTTQTAPDDINQTFTARWSGSQVKVKMAEKTFTLPKVGDELEIVDVKGNTFFVKPTI